jgi:carbon monoxide dehydrogenase subunit G
MKVAGNAVLNAPVARVWDALLDPAVLVATIPGCERLETTGENSYAMTVTAGVASIKGTYAGTCSLSDLKPHESLVLKAAGSGAPGTVSADVVVTFADNGDGTTTLDYAADAVVGGMVGGVGQRMLTSVSKRMAGEFFGAVDRVLTGTAAPAAAAAAPAAPVDEDEPVAVPQAAGVFTAPAKQAAVGAPDDFLKGVVLGAGLVLLGAVVGGVLGRRR